jgi:hypothetical protein
MTGLSELFHDLADEAKCYDVTEGVLRGARRRRRMRLAAAPAALVAVVALVAAGLSARPETRRAPLATPPASPSAARVLPKACVPQVLPLAPGYAYGLVAGGDPTGRLLVGVLDLSGERARSVIWADGQIQLLSPPGRQASVADINSSGVAIGNSLVMSRNWEVNSAWAYHDGEYTVLKGERAQVSAINEQGVIVGNVDGRPALWRSVTAQPELLALPFAPEDFVSANAFGVADDGTVIGVSNDSRPPAALLWRPDGTLDTLPQARLFSSISAGWVTGVDATGLVRWNLRTRQVEPVATLGGVNALVNAQGWMAGATGDGGLAVVAGAEQLKLPAPPGALQPQAVVSVLSDDGRTVAGWFGGDPKTEQFEAMPVVWHCS